MTYIQIIHHTDYCMNNVCINYSDIECKRSLLSTLKNNNKYTVLRHYFV